MRTLILSAAVVAAGLGAWALAGGTNAADSPKKEPAKKPDKKTVKELMGRKLTESQKLLGALVVNDLDKAAKSAEELLKIRKQAAWMIHKTKDYEMWSNEFESNAQRIIKAARSKSLDNAKLAYLEMTQTCFHCHAYVRDLGDVRLQGPAE